MNTETDKPTALEVNDSGIPQELKARTQWVNWKFEFDESRKKKWTKRPINPKTGRFASSTNPSTWGTFSEAWSFYQNHKDDLDGIGFVFAENDSVAGIDLDGCRDPETAEITPWALEIVAKMNSFTEISPSGKGLHIFVEGKLPGNGINTERIEMYDCKRYFTVTGQTL